MSSQIRSDWVQQFVGEDIQVRQELCIFRADCFVFQYDSLLQGLRAEIQTMQVCGKQLWSLLDHHLSIVLLVPAMLPSEAEESGALNDHFLVNYEALLWFSLADKDVEGGAEEVVPGIVVSRRFVLIRYSLAYLGRFADGGLTADFPSRDGLMAPGGSKALLGACEALLEKTRLCGRGMLLPKLKLLGTSVRCLMSIGRQ
jgi:hypothetical protein